MDSIMQNALKRTSGETLPQDRFKLEPISGTTLKNVDYFKQAEEEFGISVKKAKIVAIGCGGAGQNSITRLTEMGVEGATTISINTDAKALTVGKADKKILIGKELTRGLGCGGYPEVGKKAAEESRNEIKAALEGADILFAVAGLGKGTGTGSIPVVCEIAKSMGALAIAAVEMPFKVEGVRVLKAEEGLTNLRQVCDTAIVIENDRLLKWAGNLTIQQAFAVADELIANMIKGITETITLPSLVNLDYADVKTVMGNGEVAAIGVGESNSSNKAKDAIENALANPLLEVDYAGASGALIHITGGTDLTLDETNLIGETVAQHLDPSAHVFWGVRILPEFEHKVQVISIITGVKSPYILGPMSVERTINRELSPMLGIDTIR
jgi:cell division protein FtsZ